MAAADSPHMRSFFRLFLLHQHEMFSLIHTLFLSAMEGHGECEIKVQLNCSHCKTQSCKREEESHFLLCVCEDDEFLASDNVTCISAAGTLLAFCDEHQLQCN